MKSKYIMLGLLCIVILSCILKKNTKENYAILAEEDGPADTGEPGGLKKIGSSMIAKDCQDECEKDTSCKYVNRPAHLKEWEPGECWRAADWDQEITGEKNKGNNGVSMVTWFNEKYVRPPISVYKGSYGGYTFGSRVAAENHCKSKGLQLCYKSQLIDKRNETNPDEVNNNVNVCNSGWAKDGRGWWVGRNHGWGCGGAHKHWNGWHSWAGSSAHCCSKGKVP